MENEAPGFPKSVKTAWKNGRKAAEPLSGPSGVSIRERTDLHDYLGSIIWCLSGAGLSVEHSESLVRLGQLCLVEHADARAL